MSGPFSEPTFSCDACGKQFFWKPEVAGRRGKCPCGAVTRIPLHPPAAAGDAGPYDDQAAAAAAPPAPPRAPGRSGTHDTVPPPYPKPAAANNDNGKSAGVFGGFKRRIFGRKDDGR